MKRVIPILILAVLIVFYFLPARPKSTDLSLRKSTTQTDAGEVQTSTYVDDTGRAVVASDKGYATVRKTLEDGKVVLEEYLGADGAPVTIPAGYSSIKRVYTDGLNTTIAYLDTAGSPVVINNGYDTIRRSYNDRKLMDTDTYYVSGEQVCRKQGYASLHRFYGTGADAKRVIRQEYRGLDGSLVLNSSGYAILTREYNNARKVKKERYFGVDEEPVALSLGHSGFARSYDEEGRVVETTYLGPDGQPVNTILGYASIRNTYDAEATKHLYYDASGTPTTAAHGEYGYMTSSDGGKVYLDKDGELLRRLDIFLNANPLAVLVLGAIFTTLALIVPEKWQAVLLAAYLCFVVLMTLAWREGIDTVKDELFWSYKRFFSSPFLRKEIINNIFLFIPLGVILTRLLGNTRMRTGASVLLISLCASVLVELIQLIGSMGVFEFDDMISNVAGGGIGMLLANYGKEQRRQRKS